VTHDLDVRAFWEENARCMVPFSIDKPRVPLTIMLDAHFILGVVALPSTVRYFQDLVYRLEVNRACNQRLEAAIGRRFYPEATIHRFKGDFEIAMGATRVITEGNTPWIVPCDVDRIEDVKRWIDWAAKLDVRDAAIPDGWYEIKARFEASTGAQLQLAGFGNTGPATLACSILGILIGKYYTFYLIFNQAVEAGEEGLQEAGCFVFNADDAWSSLWREMAGNRRACT